jgi:hypothetical protein
MRERHLDGTVLIRHAAGGAFEPLARPDLFITDADRASAVTSRRKDRDASLIGVSIARVLEAVVLKYSRYHNGYAYLAFLSITSL